MSEYEAGVISWNRTVPSNELHSGSYRLLVKGGNYEEGDIGCTEVPSGGWNQWFLAGYWDEELTMTTTHRNASASDVYFKVVGEDGGVGFDEEHPTVFDEDRIFDPVITIGANHPKYPIGITLVKIPLRPSNGEYSDDVGGIYAGREWEYDVDSFPEKPDECAGVRFRIHLNEDRVNPGDTHEVSLTTSFGYTYMSLCPMCGYNPRTYSETIPLTPNVKFDVI